MANEVKIVLTAVDNASATLKKAGDTAKKTGMDWKASYLAVGAGAAVAISFLRSSVVEAKESAKIQAQLTAVLESTAGAAGLTAAEINKMSGEFQDLTGVEDDVITKSAAVMLTFTKIGKDIFPQAMAAVLDMSAALGQDLQSSVIQIGKALNDPIQGITALQRVGVSFTDDQKKMVEELVNSGRILEAQKYILAELETEFGGVAKAMNDASGGANDLTNAWKNLKEEVGTGLLPAVGDANSGLTGLLNTTTNFIKLIDFQEKVLSKDILTMEEWDALKYKIAFTDYTVAEALEFLIQKTVEYDQKQLILNADSYEGQREITRLALAQKLLTDQTGDTSGATQLLTDKMNALSEANMHAKRTTEDWLAALDTGLSSTISGFLEQLAFMQAGGGELQATAEAVKQALLKKEITPAEAEKYWKALAVGAAAVQVEMDQLSIKEAATNISEELGVTFRDAVVLIESAQAAMGNITADQAAQNIANTLHVSLKTAIRLIEEAERKASFNATATVTVRFKTVPYHGDYSITVNPWTPGKQHGGPVAGGMPYIVGEAGPELFVPKQSGSIVPNNKMSAGGISIGEINVFASSGMDEETVARMVIARLSAAARHSGYAGLDYAG